MARSLIDDSEEILTLVRGVAERIGFAADTLSNTQSFMKTFIRFKPDIVMLGIVMLDMDGIEIIQWLADVDYTGQLVVMFGHTDYGRIGKSLADVSGRMVVTPLPKPFRIDELEATLRACVAKSPLKFLV